MKTFFFVFCTALLISACAGQSSVDSPVASVAKPAASCGGVFPAVRGAASTAETGKSCKSH